MIFEILPDDIKALSDVDLRTLVGLIVEEELSRQGYSASYVTYGGHQNASDGGVDVRVAMPDVTAPTGYVPKPNTGYQVKAEDMPATKIASEMRPAGNLREVISELAAQGGAYVIVSSKGSYSDTSLKKRITAMKDAVKDDPNASKLVVDFYDRQRMVTWVNQNPRALLIVRQMVGRPLSGWKPFSDWSSSPDNLDAPYFADDSLRLVGVRLKDTGGLTAVDGINKLREILDAPKGAVRIVGLSGVGKTRLVQALFDARIGDNPLDLSLVVYTDLADKPDPIPQQLFDQIQNSGKRCVFIVDNCGTSLHRKLVTQMSANSKMSLVTVEYDISDDEPEHTDVFKLEPSSPELIEKVLERRFPSLSAPEIRTISKFSEGNSRVALALANTAKEGVSLANMNDQELFERLFYQNKQESPRLMNATMACSLVYSFDAETLGEADEELPIIAKLCEQTIGEIHGHVAELQSRQLVQERSIYRAVLPHALAHKLAKQALKHFHPSMRQKFIQQMPDRMLRSFSRRIGALHDSPEAQAIIGKWLSPGGLLNDVAKLDELHLTVLENIAPVNPKAVLDAIEVAIASGEKFKKEYEHLRKHSIVRLLRAIAYEPEFFVQATQLIANLVSDGEASNNQSDADNVFPSLFHLYLSGTHATVSQRADLLRILSKSANPRIQKLVLSGLSAMMETGHFSSSYSFEFGTRKRDYGYHPATKGDTHNWYREVVKLVLDLEKNAIFRQDVRRLVAEQFTALAKSTGIPDEFITLANTFAEGGGWPEGWGAARTVAREAKKAGQTEFKAKFHALAERLKPLSLSERITTYVTPKHWGGLDLAEVDFEDEKKHEKAQQQIEEVCVSIGKEIAQDFALLDVHLPEMLKSDSTRTLTVGTAIGQYCSEPKRVWEKAVDIIFNSGDGYKFHFLANVLSGIAKQNRGVAEELLDRALGDVRTHKFFVSMQSMVGLDTAGCSRIVAAVSVDTIPTYSFRTLAYGGVTKGLRDGELLRLLSAINSREGGFAHSIEILHMDLYVKTRDKGELCDQDRDVARSVLSEVEFDKTDRQLGYNLGEVIRWALQSSVDGALARKICQCLKASVSSYKVSVFDFSDVLNKLSVLFPLEVLEELLPDQTDTLEHTRSFFGDLRRFKPCPLNEIPDSMALEWAQHNPGVRFEKLAAAISPYEKIRPDDQFIDPDEAVGELKWTSTALMLMQNAPDPKKILELFAISFRPMSWSGSRAVIMESRIGLLQGLVDDISSPISQAAAELLEDLKKGIEREKQYEAKSARETDERFEW